MNCVHAKNDDMILLFNILIYSVRQNEAKKRTAKKSATNVKQIVWHFNLFAKHVQEHPNGSGVKKNVFFYYFVTNFIKIYIWGMGMTFINS